MARSRPGGFDAFTMDDYTITEDGRVFNKRWNRYIKPQKNSKGYLRVGIVGKLRFVHRLVAEKYVPNPLGLPQVNHKDGNKLNNRADNLEWVTNKQNRQHAVKNDLQIQGERCPWAKLSEEDVLFIRNAKDVSNKELAKQFNVNRSHIASIRRYNSWKSV